MARKTRNTAAAGQGTGALQPSDGALPPVDPPPPSDETEIPARQSVAPYWPAGNDIGVLVYRLKNGGTFRLLGGPQDLDGMVGFIVCPFSDLDPDGGRFSGLLDFAPAADRNYYSLLRRMLIEQPGDHVAGEPRFARSDNVALVLVTAVGRL